MDAYEGILSEHEAPPDQSGKSGYDPTPEERKAIKLAQKKFRCAKKGREKVDSQWRTYYRYFRGQQWTSERPSYRHSEIMNFIFQHIQSQAPLQTDKNPTVNFIPREPSDTVFAEIMNMAFKSDWEQFNWLMQLTEMIYDGYIYGTGICSVGFDPEELDGRGAVTFESQDPCHIYPDPDARDVNHKCEYIVFAKPTDTAKVKRKYPHLKEFIKPDMQAMGERDYGDISESTEVFGDDTKYISPGNYSDPDNADRGVPGRDQTLVITVFMDSDEIEEQEVETENGVEYEQRLKYPNGRVIKIAGNVLLHDGPNPYQDGKFPFVRYVNYVDPRKFWGISEVEQIKSPQDTFNKLVSFSLDVLTMMGNPVWIIPTTSGIDTDNIFNSPGEILEPDDSSGMQRLDGGNLQPWVMQFIDRLKVWFDDISGSQDITRGAAPEGVKAASAIAQLQDAAQTRIRQKMRNLDCTVKDFGRLWLSRALQFYRAPRMLRITNRDESRDFFRMSLEQGEDGQIKAIVSKFEETPDGRMVESPRAEETMKGDLDVFVETGSSLPFAKFEREQRLYALFDRQIIDAEEVLEGLDYPNKEKVLQRMQERQQAEAEAAAAQQGA